MLIDKERLEVVFAFAAGVLGVGSDVLALPAGPILLVLYPVTGLLGVLAAPPHLLDPLSLQRQRG